MTETGDDAIWARFASMAKRHPERLALIDAQTGRQHSYNELAAAALGLAGALEVTPHRNIAFIGEPRTEHLPLLLACARLGRTFMPLDSGETDAGLLEATAALPGDTLIAARRQVRGGRRRTGPGVLEELPDLNWFDPPATGDIIDETEGTSPFLVTRSSGSTGQPKAVAFTQRTKLHRTEQSINLFDIRATDIILSASPLHHSLGQRHLFCALMTGATLVRAIPFNPDHWLTTVRRYRPTFAIPVATHLKLLQKTLFEEPRLLASFRCLITSSAPAEPEFKRRVLGAGGFDFWEIYGMTETACVTAVRYEPGKATDHLGRAIPGTAIRIDGEGRAGPGEILVRSDCLCDGYLGEPERWRTAFTEDGWFRSGDLGRTDEDGNLIYCGRVNESFESGGVIIYPKEIEEIVAILPSVKDCIAFGVPDPIFGNIVALCVIADNYLTDRELIRSARQHLPRHLWPGRLFRRDAFPELTSGKVDRRGLIAEMTKCSGHG